jgi:hypothetical protein
MSTTNYDYQQYLEDLENTKKRMLDADNARALEYMNDLDEQNAIGDFGLGPINKWKHMTWRPVEDGWGGEEEQVNPCGHAEYDGACGPETCGKGMTNTAFIAQLEKTEPWHECVEEKRLLTAEGCR